VTTLIITACASQGATSSSGASQSQATVRLGYAGANQTVIPFDTAQELGYFAKSSLTINSVTLSNGPAMIAALLSGSIDVATALTPIQVAPAVQKGNSLVYFCGLLPVDENTLLAAPSSTLKDASAVGGWQGVFKELVGKKIGIVAIGGGAQIQIESALRQAGVDPNKVTFVATGAGTAGEAAFLAGQVDVLWGDDITTPTLVGNGEAKPLVTIGGNKPSPNIRQGAFDFGYVATRSWVTAHKKQASEFCSAIGRAISYLQSPGAASVYHKVLRVSLGVTDPRVLAAAASIPSLFSTSISPTAMGETLKALVTSGVLAPNPPVTVGELIDLANKSLAQRGSSLAAYNLGFMSFVPVGAFVVAAMASSTRVGGQ
jgi:NitT/TauT family transport system substrate-binding protein